MEDWIVVVDAAVPTASARTAVVCYGLVRQNVFIVCQRCSVT